MVEEHLKVVLVGDTCGKTSIIEVLTTGSIPSNHASQKTSDLFRTYQYVFSPDGYKNFNLILFDTPGASKYNDVRPNLYSDVDVFLLCFSIMNPESFYNVTRKWVPEIRKHVKNAKILLVGNQIDMRNDMRALITLNQKYKRIPVSRREGIGIARKIKAFNYVECSAKTQEGIEEVFEEAVRIAKLKVIPKVPWYKRCK